VLLCSSLFSGILVPFERGVPNWKGGVNLSRRYGDTPHSAGKGIPKT